MKYIQLIKTYITQHACHIFRPFLICPNELSTSFQLLRLSFCGLPIQPVKEKEAF